MTPEEVASVIDAQTFQLVTARDILRILIIAAPDINTGAENQLKNLIIDRIEAIRDVLDTLVFT